MHRVGQVARFVPLLWSRTCGSLFPSVIRGVRPANWTRWMSGLVRYKLDHINYSNAFNFHSSAFRFMSIVTVSWYTVRVYTLYT
jgi:hypothetical protein